MDVPPLHKYLGDMSPLSYTYRRPCPTGPTAWRSYRHVATIAYCDVIASDVYVYPVRIEYTTRF